MIFGRGGGGGIVNRVIKRAELRRLSRGADLDRQLRRRSPDRRPRPAARLRTSASGSTAFTRMATASAATSTSSATASTRPSAFQAGPRHAHRRRLRIFPRPPDRRPRRSGRRQRGRSKGFDRDLLRRSRRQLSPRRTSMSARFAIEHELRRRPDDQEPDAVRRLRQILSEHLPERRCNAATGRRHAGRLQQPQRPAEPVQPDRPGLGEPPRRDRPDLAVRLRGRPPEVAQPPHDRHIPATAATTPL